MSIKTSKRNWHAFESAGKEVGTSRVRELWNNGKRVGKCGERLAYRLIHSRRDRRSWTGGEAEGEVKAERIS